MQLVNMKGEGEAQCAPCPPEAYPYGLRLCLSDEQCKKLGILGPVSVGSRMNVEALVTVVMCRQEREADDTGSPEVYLDLQVTDMAIVPQSKLYPNSKMEA